MAFSTPPSPSPPLLLVLLLLVLLLRPCAAQNPWLQAFPCAPPPVFSQHQAWEVLPDAGSGGAGGEAAFALVYAASRTSPAGDGAAVCAAVQGGAAPGARLWPFGCGSSPGAGQRFALDAASGALTHAASGLCVAAASAAAGAAVALAACDAGAPLQRWAFSAASGQLAFGGGVGCLDWNSPQRTGPCGSADSAALPFCNVSLPLPARVADLVARVAAVPERAGLLNTVQAAVDNATERVHLPSLQWWSEALHGVASSPGVQFGGAVRGATAFPQVLLTAASFNRSLFRAVGATVGREARAMANVGQGGLTYWSPNLNFPRDPRWGRGQETPGEDVFLGAAYAREWVPGLQEAPADPRYLQVSAACKHWAAYDLEAWNGSTRHDFNAVVSERDLLDSYAPAFQACVSDARSSGVMCSYNAVNGTPSCASNFLLTQLLRNEWSFGGYVVSDCGAVGDILNAHKFTNTSDATAAAVLSSGLDIGCDPFLTGALPAALASGAVSDDEVAAALFNFLHVRFRLGVFDEPYSAQPLRQTGAEAVCTDAALALALDAAQQGMTLLKQAGGGAGLPLRAGGALRLAVLGPLANRTDVFLGSYYGPGCFGELSPLVDAVAAFAASVSYAPGCDVDSNDTSRIAAAAAAAAAADATVLVVGLDQSVAREGVDRYAIDLPGAQPQLVAAACAASRPRPCVVVLLSGSSVDLAPLLADGNVSAVLWAGFPGQAGGAAVARTLFGESAPAGRLPISFYRAAYVDEVSMFDMSMRPGSSPWPPGSTKGRTHRFYAGAQLLLPFGFGLSYSSFAYACAPARAEVSLRAARDFVAAHAGRRTAPLSGAPLAVSYTVRVTNTGRRDSDEVVLGFLVPPGAGAGGLPLQELFGFARVHVRAGETAEVALAVTARDLTQLDEAGRRFALGGRYRVRFGVAAAPAGVGFAEAEFEAQD